MFKRIGRKNNNHSIKGGVADSVMNLLTILNVLSLAYYTNPKINISVYVTITAAITYPLRTSRKKLRTDLRCLFTTFQQFALNGVVLTNFRNVYFLRIGSFLTFWISANRISNNRTGCF